MSRWAITIQESGALVDRSSKPHRYFFEDEWLPLKQICARVPALIRTAIGGHLARGHTTRRSHALFLIIALENPRWRGAAHPCIANPLNKIPRDVLARVQWLRALRDAVS